jgi:hypothetical protein
MTRRKLKPGTFVCVPATLVLDQDLGKVALRLAMLIASCGAECTLSTQTMASRLQVPRSSVVGALSDLVAHGHVNRRPRTEPGRGRTSSAYALVFRDLEGVKFPAPEAPPTGLAPDAGLEGSTPSEPASQSAGLDRKKLSTVPPDDRPSRSPAPDPVTAFSGLGDRFLADPMTEFSGHDSKDELKNDLDDEAASSIDAPCAREETPAAAASDIDQALVLYDEMADRTRLPRANKLTQSERKMLGKRLADCRGLEGWRRFVDKVEQSRFLTEKMRPAPTMRWFLDEDHFARTARGDYDRDRDPPPQRGVHEGVAMAFKRREGRALADAGAAQQSRQAAPPPSPPCRPSERPARLRVADEVSLIAQYASVNEAEVQGLVDQWLAALVHDGRDQAAAEEHLVWELRRMPKSGSALIRLRERVAAFMQGRAMAA